MEEIVVSATVTKGQEPSVSASVDNTKIIGIPGPKGDPGYTPIKGKDYWTDDDIAQIKSYVDEAILGGAW